jgi:hypothetical protein
MRVPLDGGVVRGKSSRGMPTLEGDTAPRYPDAIDDVCPTRDMLV